MLLVISVDSSFVHICSINKNISFSWLDFIFGIILNGWLEHLLILIKILGAFRFLNVILVDLWFISWIFNLLLIMLGLLGILSRGLIILLLRSQLVWIVANCLGSLLVRLGILVVWIVLRSCLRILLDGCLLLIDLRVPWSFIRLYWMLIWILNWGKILIWSKWLRILLWSRIVIRMLLIRSNVWLDELLGGTLELGR